MGKFIANFNNLPHNKSFIDWEHSIGYTFQFNYNNGQIIGDIKILDYKKENSCRYLLLQYDNNTEWCSIRRLSDNDIKLSILGLTRDYSQKKQRKPKQIYNFGDIIHTSNSDLKIVGVGLQIPENGMSIRNNQNNKSAIIYQVFCNKCECLSTRTQQDIKIHPNCPICCGKIIVPGINDIVTREPWMVDFFQGGVDEAQKYAPQSNSSILPKCPKCGKVSKNLVMISNIFKNKSFKCECSDHNSYPEKYLISLLNQLHIDFSTQYSSHKLNPNVKYKLYDFYLSQYSMIIETHGIQHYSNGFEQMNGITLEEQIKNDKLKKQIAIECGIKNYIVIDARKSYGDYIKSSILHSELPSILGFQENDIDWLECDKYATKNIVYEICKDYMDYLMDVLELADKYHKNRSTIVRSLNKGYELGWCYYDSKYAPNHTVLKVTVKEDTVYTLSINDALEYIQIKTNGSFNSISILTNMIKKNKTHYKDLFSYEIITNEFEKACAIRNKLNISTYRSIFRRKKRR